jgi:hypothetical protein
VLIEPFAALGRSELGALMDDVHEGVNAEVLVDGVDL